MEVRQLKAARHFGLLLLLLSSLFSGSQLKAQLPAGAVVFKRTTAKFLGVEKPLDVVFYKILDDSAEVVLLGPNGRTVARAHALTNLGLFKGTGVYDVTGDKWPEVVMVTLAGAKTIEVAVYSFEKGQLREIGRWSGNGFKVIELRGTRVVALNGPPYLTQLYRWEHGEFVDANEAFPEFFAPEIEQRRRILHQPGRVPPYVVAEACELAAHALVYGKNYDQADRLCREALEVARSSAELVTSAVGGGPESLQKDRQEAAQKIKQTLGRIARAKSQGVSRLPGK